MPVQVRTDDYIVIKIRGRSSAGGNPDTIAGKIMSQWGFVQPSVNGDGDFPGGLVSSTDHKGKHQLRVWVEAGQRQARLMFVNGSNEYNLDKGVVVSGRAPVKGSTRVGFVLKGNQLVNIEVECDQIADAPPVVPATSLNGSASAPISPNGSSVQKTISLDTVSKLRPVAPTPVIMEIPIVLISRNPEQPRKNFNRHELIQLGNSMKEEGQNEPIEVVLIQDGPIPRYELVKGERRWRAAQAIEMETLRAIVLTRKEIPNRDVQHRRCFVADFHHSKYSDYETAVALLHEQKAGLSPATLASICGKKVAWVKKYLKLSTLHSELFKLMDPQLPRSERLSLSLARILAEVPGDNQKEIYRQVVAVKGTPLRLIKASQLATGLTPHSRRGRRSRPSDNVDSMLEKMPRILADSLLVSEYPLDSFESLASRRPEDAALTLRHATEAIGKLYNIREKLRAAMERDTEFKPSHD